MHISPRHTSSPMPQSMAIVEPVSELDGDLVKIGAPPFADRATGRFGLSVARGKPIVAQLFNCLSPLSAAAMHCSERSGASRSPRGPPLCMHGRWGVPATLFRGSPEHCAPKRHGGSGERPRAKLAAASPCT